MEIIQMLINALGSETEVQPPWSYDCQHVYEMSL